ncbi:alpha/beta hydrolase fold domain-containing protein [Aeromicrobium sp.]|uniref:alpha/beta hydrolase n=1 Tax=Aeromicrobium sp. TaxID=1871063 RepID=UPI0019C6DC7E|nr:alpha/beta hydrolase fold domain-containing protein [Aeromicrobium sp.]MBC7632686.1 alpha/beta hydrolase fold domain-containing protein [Aeromicrobium sp.]
MSPCPAQAVAELQALAGPESIALLHTWPDIDAAAGVDAVQSQIWALLAAVPGMRLRDGVSRTVEQDGTRVFTTADAATDRGILWIHGGGLIAGEPKQDDAHCGGMAAEHSVVVRAFAYGLPPQARYPSDLEDCVAALQQGDGAPRVGAPRLRERRRWTRRSHRVGRARQEHRGHPGGVAYLPMIDDRAGRMSMDRMTVRKVWRSDVNRLA